MHWAWTWKPNQSTVMKVVNAIGAAVIFGGTTAVGYFAVAGFAGPWWGAAAGLVVLLFGFPPFNLLWSPPVFRREPRLYVGTHMLVFCGVATTIRWMRTGHQREVVAVRVVPPVGPTHVELRRHDGTQWTVPFSDITSLRILYRRVEDDHTPSEVMGALVLDDDLVRLRAIPHSTEMKHWVAAFKAAGVSVSEAEEVVFIDV
ncbi:hypothetical protein Acsp05_17480 [Actinokineospora sp. NBRC 105648]|nr:hypothetical protein Acsp05_17480 [Actinokineospora sp. NBRC 105648]